MPNIKNWSIKKRVLCLLLTVTVVLGLMTVVVFRAHLAPPSLMRWYRHTFQADTSLDSFPHLAQTDNVFLPLGENLLLCADSSIRLFSPRGDTLFQEVVTLPNPVISLSGERAAIYSVGGQELRLIDQTELAFTLTLPPGKVILSATVNESGWLALTTKQDGYKAIVEVYDEAFKPVVTIRLSSRYLTDAIVTPDCRGLYALSPGQKDGLFENTLLFYTFTDCTAPTSEISLGNGVALMLQTMENRCWILGENALFIFDSSAKLIGQYDYGVRYLKKANLNGGNFATLFLSYSQSDAGGTLFTIGPDGTELGSVDLTTQVLSLSANKGYVAALTGDALQVYDKNLAPFSTTNAIQSIRKIALFPSGTTALISDEAVSLYLPD